MAKTETNEFERRARALKNGAFERLYNRIFGLPRKGELTHRIFVCRMSLLFLTMLACVAITVSSTLAVFYVDISGARSTIASANYSLAVDGAADGRYVCPASFGDMHVFRLTADGSASVGYCRIEIGDDVYYTEQIPKGTSIVLTVYAAKGTPIIFTPCWGELSNYLNVAVCTGAIVHSETEYALCEVQSGAELYDIALHYGVSERDILEFNGINAVFDGCVLKIPGVSPSYPPYVIPQTPVQS